MARTIEFYVESAAKAFEAGFTSKAGQKRAFEDLARASDLVWKELVQVLWDLQKADSDRARALDIAYWMNRDLHVWSEKRRVELLGHMPEAEKFADQLDDLAALRLAIKAAPVVKIERKVDEREVRIMKSIRELMELRQSQYERGLKLHDLFNGLPVHGNVHYVTNQHGTTFVRTFYYLNGVLTPLNIIFAVLDTKAREAEAAKA